jgi:dTDP-4-amino-4,6-dideoxygalactose transaminase
VIVGMKKLDEPILVTKSFLPPFDEYISQIEKIWDSHWLTNQGPLHQRFMEDSKAYLKVRNIVPVVNGHLALEIAIKALELKGNVITTPFTFASTTHSLVLNGVEPRFCDINLSNFTIDVDKIEELIDSDTTAIMPVHVFGYPCNVSKIEEIAKKHNLKVIYDAAHVFGVEVGGVGIGNYGDVSMFSLHATKIFHAIEGGLLSFKESDLEKKFNLYKNFGISGPERVEAVGMNAKMNEFQAAMGLANLKYVNGEIAKRQAVVNKYREILAHTPGIRFLSDMPGVRHNYAYFPIIVLEEEYGMNRDVLHKKLEEYNIFARKYFYPLTCDFPCFGQRFQDDYLPNARHVSQRVLTLPLYGDLDIEVAGKIGEIIKHLGKVGRGDD